jgi:hypothetical protein
MLWVLYTAIFTILLILILTFVRGYKATSQYIAIQREVLTTLENIKRPDIITREVALQNARRSIKSRKNIQQSTGGVGFDPSRYFMNRNETAIAKRLREFDINPDEIDIPPAIKQIDRDEQGVLPPPNPTDGRNEGFFQRFRRNGN